MHKSLHPRYDVDRLYESRNEGGRGFASIQDSVDASIKRLEDFIKKSAEEDWLRPLEKILRHNLQQNTNNQKTK